MKRKASLLLNQIIRKCLHVKNIFIASLFFIIHILFKLILECVIFRTSATFRAAVLIRGEVFIRGWFVF